MSYSKILRISTKLKICKTGMHYISLSIKHDDANYVIKNLRYAF